MDYHSNPDWTYSGDINAHHGGIWIRHYGDYCEAIEIVDLDSACGFTGAVLIERKTVGLGRSLAENKRRVASALAAWGMTVRDLERFSRARARAMIWQAMLGYGYGDSDKLELLQLKPDGPMQFDGWTAERRQTRGDVGGYVMARHLD